MIVVQINIKLLNGCQCFVSFKSTLKTHMLQNNGLSRTVPALSERGRERGKTSCVLYLLLLHTHTIHIHETECIQSFSSPRCILRLQIATEKFLVPLLHLLFVLFNTSRLYFLSKCFQSILWNKTNQIFINCLVLFQTSF